jgi:hypothetical protein
MALYFGIAALNLFTTDDAPGTQTCHNVAVTTTWRVPVLVAEFKDTERGSSFSIPTNSRALRSPVARQLIVEICQNHREASNIPSKPYEIVLRGDSTLRRHLHRRSRQAVDQVLGRSDVPMCLFGDVTSRPVSIQGFRLSFFQVMLVEKFGSLVWCGVL